MSDFQEIISGLVADKQSAWASCSEPALRLAALKLAVEAHRLSVVHEDDVLVTAQAFYDFLTALSGVKK